MKHISVDFNTLNNEPVDLVKFPQDGTPALEEGERVILTDGELEAEATVVPYVTAWGERDILARPDRKTWRDLVPQEIPTPPIAGER